MNCFRISPMHEAKELVINTSPLISLVAALGNLDILHSLYSRVVVPAEVSNEILDENASRFAAAEFRAALWLEKKKEPVPLTLALKNMLGPGEAAVIQWALTEKINLVCIDEAVGRRIARLNGLQVTGSLGMLVRAKRDGFPILLREAINSMRSKGIWLSDHLVEIALREAGE